MKKILYSLFLLVGFTVQSQDTLTVYFDFDVDVLSNVQASMAFDELKKQSIEVLKISGYCDKRGSETYNKKLAKRRIDFVLNTLGGLKPTFEEVIGEDYPMPEIYQEEDWRKVIVIYSKQSNIPVVAIPDNYQTEEEHVHSIPVHSEVLIEYSDKSIEDAVEDFVNSEDSVLIYKLGVNFHPGMSTILPESMKEVDRLVKIMKKNPHLKAFIRGHICCSPVDVNMLSEDRAKTIVIELIQNKIDNSRLSYQGFGRSIPAVDPEYTEADRIANRRVDVVFTKVE